MRQREEEREESEANERKAIEASLCPPSLQCITLEEHRRKVK
jgi:hypothetical protein